MPTAAQDPISVQQLLQQMGLDELEIARRKEFLEFGPDDAERLASLSEKSSQCAEPVVEDLYRHFFRFEETRAFFQDPEVLVRVKDAQRKYFVQLTSGEYGPAYAADRLRIGVAHERIGLAIKWYLGAYAFYLCHTAARMFDMFANPSEPAVRGFFAWLKLIFFDLGLVIETYTYQREQTIRRQQEAIRALERERAQVQQQEVLRELSTPVLQLRERLLLLPIVGLIDSQRARQITEGLLQAIRANRARVVVIDITGVAAVDSKVANHLVKTVAAAKLMGACVIVTGLSAEVSMALVALGVDLGTINTVGDLQGGIEEAERLLGYRVVRVGDEQARATPALSE